MESVGSSARPSDEVDSASPGSRKVDSTGRRAAVTQAFRAASTQNFTNGVLNSFSGRKKEARYKTIARNIVDNKYFIGFTMFLTIYALCGDDFRILCTEKPSDIFFNWTVVVAMVIFSFEFLCSVLGKKDYNCSFFFWLDIVSTVSLVLDITVVSNSLFAVESEDENAGANDLRGGRAAKIGAKAGRVVRVLRLVRILKLYKAVYEARQREKDRERRLAAKANLPGGDADDWDEDDMNNQDQKVDKFAQGRESHVGRKLSEMTTRRVICIILAMLLGLPLMQGEQSDQAAFSSEYGVEQVWRNFYNLANASDDVADNSSASASTREDYEASLLAYIYYHNWFAQNHNGAFCEMGNCSNLYYASLFWVGVVGKEEDVVANKSRFAHVQELEPTTWQAQYNVREHMYNYGTMPTQVTTSLQSQWTRKCRWGSRTAYGISLLAEEIEGSVGYTVLCPNDLRPQEYSRVAPKLITLEQYANYYLVFYFDVRPFVRTDAVYNLLKTVTLLILLIMVSLMFSNDANRLIVHPVERMIKRVEAIRDNPLIAMQMADEEFQAEEIAKAKKRLSNKKHVKVFVKKLLTCEVCASGESAPMETLILEKTIIKLGSLLALGFGEAGANIIGHNMKGSETAGVDAMIPGTRVDCIIGVVRVRDFSTATEVLQSKIMTFVNQIAEIVHGVVNEFHGAPNRNSGESFLVVWRVLEFNEGSKNVTAELRLKAASKRAGMSIVACARILGGLHRSPLLATYRTHPGLQYRLGAGCRVNLSFGLHAGWAIEGAVGSEYKIDASYLSPNVSIALSVERATSTYAVSLLVSQSVVRLCNRSLMSKCRLIDKVIIIGSPTPMELFCVDLDYRSVTVDKEEPITIVWNTRNRFKVRQFMESEKAALNAEDADMAQIFDSDPTIRDMRRRYTVEFFQLFNMGYQNYSQGEWQVARRMLSCTRAILGTEDGPSSALLRHMEVPHQFQAPRKWRGVRELATAESAIE